MHGAACSSRARKIVVVIINRYSIVISTFLYCVCNESILASINGPLRATRACVSFDMHSFQVMPHIHSVINRYTMSAAAASP